MNARNLISVGCLVQRWRYILCHTVIGGCENSSQFFDEMRTVSSLLQLFNHSNDNVIIDTLSIDLDVKMRVAW